jgi:RimJ/RimL family protein N-acetyltransferase
MIVRPLTRDDLPEVFETYAATAAEARWIAAEPPVDRDDKIAGWGARADGVGGTMLVAEIDGRVAGAAGLEWQSRCGSGLLSLGMWVAREHRGRGVGSALLEACISWARSAGAHKITLEVWPHNEPAIALYRKSGFEQEGYLRDHWRRRNGELWDSVIMGLRLDPPAV